MLLLFFPLFSIQNRFHDNFVTLPDAENDKILLSCEEDFRLYIEQGRGKKVYFNVTSGHLRPEEEDDVAMEAEESNEKQQKLDRRARKW